MNSSRFVILGVLAVLACVTSPLCHADEEWYGTPIYTDSTGAQRYMEVGAEVDQPANNAQFWAVAGVADTCYDVEESGSWTWAAYCNLRTSDEYNISGEADTYFSSGQHWNGVASYDTEFPLPESSVYSMFSEPYSNTDSFLGSNQQQYGGISYYLQALTGMYDDTYYPGFSALVGAANGFNCACTCP